MNKRKCSEDDTDKEEEEDDEDIWDSSSIPLPIQTFLWRQTSPFIRPKISRLQDAAAMEQREACKLFEKVLVQNIQFGLSPSLTEAIHSVSRWRMIVAALPHVMHCCAALLYARRKSSFDKLSASETKLLYTLHWILLDAAEECADAETERGIHRLPEHYLLPITTIQTFVYLYAPLIPHLKQSDFLTSFRLENGYKIWIPLFHFCHPEIPSFIAHARKSKFFSSRVEKKIAAPKFGDVFIGANGGVKPAAEPLIDPCDPFSSIPPPPSSRATESLAAADGEFMSREDLKKKHQFNEKDQVEPFLATYLDVAVLRCLFTSQWIEEGIEWALHFLYRRLETISKYREKRRETLFRSNSLPTPKRKSDDKCLEGGSSKQQSESKSCRPKNDSSNESSLIAKESTQLKTGSSFQELRRSSFSGLPGLSGFQALISSTSSASFGRHGSEKVKHKKQKKGDSSSLAVKVAEGKQRSDQNIAGGRHQQEFGKHGSRAEDGGKSGKGKSKKDKSAVTASTVQQQQQQHQSFDEINGSQQERPNSATEFKSAAYDFKNRKVSLSETKLIDRNDQKGKSMPSLHLIDKRGSLTLDVSKFPTIHLTPIDSAKSPTTPTSTTSVNNNGSSDHYHHHHHHQHHHHHHQHHQQHSTVQSVPFPIITITEHSPVASMQFFNCDSESVSGSRSRELQDSTPVASNYKFFIGDEHDQQQAQQQQQQQSCAGPTGLTRSKTDSEINYCVETSSESLASINYVTKNGQLSLVVILKAIHSITLKDSVCSIRTCRIIFNIINKLISMKIITKHTTSMYKAKKHKTFKPNVENVELSIHHLFMDSLFRIVKQLGCSRGCGEGRRETDALRLKDSVMKTLKVLYDLSEAHFEQYCEMLVQSHPVQEVIDILHAFLSFCSESSSSTAHPLMPTAQHLSAFPHKKSHSEHHSRSGYGNNFSIAHIPSSKAAKVLVESIIIKCIFKPFIMRMVLVQKELKVQENMSLYCEIRQFISYVRDHHGGIFRNTALSGLIESTKYIMQNEKVQSAYSRAMRETTTIITTSASQSTMPFAFSDVNEKLLTKKLSALTPKQPTRHSTPPSNRSSELVDWPATCSNTDIGGTSRGGQRSSSPVPDDDSLTSKYERTSKAGGGGTNRPTGIKVPSWFKQSNSKVDSVPYDLNNIPNDNGNYSSYLAISDSQSDKLGRRGSFSRQTIKNYPNQNTMVLGALDQKPKFFKAKRRMDQFKNVFGKNKMKQGSFEETPDLSRKNSLQFERTNYGGHESITIRMSKTVPLQILKDGMLKFQFLLESCTPGTLPDAQLVAAMLDLKAPVIARAAFLMECSHFVHRCNRGQWPVWMRMNFNFFRPSGMVAGASRSSQTVIKNRASTTLQRAAGRTFYQWGELLSTRLEDLLQNDIYLYGTSAAAAAAITAGSGMAAILSSAAIPSSISEFQDGRRSKTAVRLTPEEDDFLSVPTATRKDSNCPLALKVLACQLLHEITTFLRETHQYLPSKSSRRSSLAARDRMPSVEASTALSTAVTVAPVAVPAQSQPTRPPVNTNRRWSMALSNMPMGTPNAHSLISLANLSGGGSTGLQAMLDHCSSIHADRRISFVLHEADSENDSSSITSIDDNRERKRLSQVGISNLLRRSTGSGHDSFKRRSIKLKKPQDKKGTAKLRSATLVEDELFKRSNSLRSNSRRKASGVSEMSETSERFSGEESPGLMSDDGHGVDSPNDTLDASDAEITTNIPWLKITSIFNKTLDFQCTHSCSCSGNCYKRVIKSTAYLIKEVQRIYEKDVLSFMDSDAFSQRLCDDKEDAARKEKKLKKILMGHSSPLKRKPSVGHNIDKQATAERDNYGTLHSSTTALVHNAVDLEMGVFEAEDPRSIFSDVLSYRMEVRQEENLTLLYMVNQVKNPFHSIISMMLKSALTLDRSQFEYLLQISWNLVIEDDIQISSAASVAVILCALKVPELVVELLNKELNNASVEVRVNTIHKFYKLWSNRYQCWQRLEDGAQGSLKLPPAAIEFTLPSPRIALECKPVVDPPYMPIVKTKVDEVAINQEPAIQKSFVAATKTRRKQQIELVARALQEQEDKLREERETYRFNGVPLTLQASYEPALFHSIEDHDDNEDDIERIPLHHMQVAQCFFPSCLTTASVQVINLLEDNQVNAEGTAVYEVAHKVVWQCLIEEPALFMRNLLERLTREKKSTIIQTMRRLIRFLPRLPNQAAFTMYNYLTGFIMHHVRTPYEDSQEIIASVMTVIWLVVPNVYGLFLKDLKQILRKEQCDATILITANVPSAKKIIVHGPDASSIPSQFPIHEDTQFSQILTDSLDFFGIDEGKHNEYFLVDTKTNQIHNLNAFVRDFYFFKRSQYPQISLVHMNPTEAFDKFQRQAFTLQFTELGKTLMSLSLIKTSFLGIQRVLFLHEELMKLPSFPRKALETNLTLYSGPMGKEVLGIDTLHKISWVKLVSKMFEVTSGFFAESADIHLFLNVVNGALLLHCEDASILRLCMSTYINAAHQFKNIFATNGYLLIVQPIVQIYANHQTNSLLCRTIEFVFKQFYILHRKPFILQMFGAVAPLLDTDAAHASYGTACQISPRAMFQLLQSLGQYTADPLDILELVEAEKPLKALDFCYQMDSEALTILDSISLCVTVISYASDSERGHQMLTVLDAILPYHLKHMQSLTTKKETPGGPRTELQMIHSISVCMKTLIYNCEALTRNYTGPQKPIDIREASFKNASPQFIEIDEDSHSKYNPDSYYPTQKYNTELDDGELSRLEYRNPRDLLLKIVSEFLTRSTARLADLSKKIPDLHQKSSSYELLDVKCHLRLAEIAHSLLKLAPYDPQTMACKGLVRYMNEILPNSEWRQEQMRPALIMVLRRLDKTFTKISKKSAIKRNTDWEAARRLLKGVYLTFTKHPYIVHLPHLKSLISVCQNIILGDLALNLSDSSSTFSSWTVALSQAPPPGFTSVAVRLISLQMIQLGDSQSLETLCSGAFSSPEKSEIYLMNMIYPLCVRITSGLKDIPKLRHSDINFILNIILNILKPISGKPGKGSDSSQVGQQLKQYSLQQIGFLGLKILITCFEKQLTTEWYRISKCIRDLADKPHLIGATFWNFLDFVSTYRTPLYVLILPYIKRKYLAKTCENEIERTYQMKISEKLMGGSLPLNRSKGSLCVSLVMELKTLREDIIRRKNNPNIDERSRSIIQEPNSTATSENRPENSGHRLSFALSQIAASASKLSNISSSNSNTAVVNPLQTSVNEPAVSSPTTSTKGSGLLRGLSFRLGTDSRRLASRGLSVKLASNQADKKMFTRRTSYPDQADSADKENECLKESHATHSEPKLNRRLTVLSKSTRVISPGSLSGETLNENDESGLENVKNLSQSKEELQPAKYRLQRQKGQNRRSLRIRTTPTRIKEPRTGISLFKSETIDNCDDLKQQQQQPLQHQPQQTTAHSIMIRSCTAENDSTTSSPSYISGGPSLLASPQERDNNDSNGNLHSSTITAIYHECSNEKTALLHMNSIDSCSNISSNNQPTLAGNNNNNNNNNSSNNNSTSSNKLNNNNEFPMRVISNLSLTLNTRPSANEATSNNVALSPFETTLTTLPFADEDV